MQVKKIVFVLIMSLLPTIIISQGYWKRVHGNGISNPPSVTGTYAPNNSPFSRYAASCATDNNDQFWLYGGSNSNDLWKFDASINQWMLAHGDYTGTTINAVYGTQGVEAPANTPGSASFGHPMWGDKNDNIWVFGVNGENNLWRFNTTSQMWAWMKGNGSGGGATVYGTQTVLAPNNNPGTVNETDCHWVDSNGDLWLYTELDGNLWKYSINDNMWAWMKGGGSGNTTPVYGTIDTYDPANTPGGFAACPSVGALYTMWVTSDDHLWMIVNRMDTDIQVEVWEYNPSINQWRCRRIDNHPFASPQSYPSACVETNNDFPVARTEMRAEWVDDCDRVYMFGGLDLCNMGASLNDIWRYDPTTNNYTYIRGGTGAQVSGTQGVFDPNNTPPSVGGSQAWQNSKGFYLFGGQDSFSAALSDDVWLYSPDTVVTDYSYNVNCLDVSFNNLSSTGCNDIKEIFWDFGNGNTSTQLNPTHTYSGNGSYTVSLSVTNCSWHTDTISKNINVNCGFNVSINTDTICEGQCINLIATSTVNPDSISYDWNQGIVDNNDTINVCPTQTTTYSLIAETNNGDIDTAQTTIVVDPGISVNLGNDTVSCGGILLEAGLTGVNYLWQDGSTNSSYWADTSGSYWVIVDNGICYDSDTIDLNIDGPYVNLGPDTTICSDTFSLDATYPNADYVWHDGSTTSTYLVDTTGTFYVEVTDTNGCSVTDTVQVSEGDLNFDLGQDTVICNNEELTLSTGHQWDQVIWQDGSTDTNFIVDTSGVYFAEVSQGNCMATDTILVILDQPEAAFSVSDTTGCSLQQISFQDVSQNSQIQSWFWSFGDGHTSSEQNPEHVYESSGDYEVKLVVTTVNGCTSDSSRTITVTIKETPQAEFTISPDQLGINSELQLSNQSLYANSFYWEFGDQTSSILENPTHEYTSEGNYTIMLIAMNKFCSDTAYGEVNIENSLHYYVPNAFTPDGDQHNNVFSPVFNSDFYPENYHLTIYNRWGEIIFESFDANKGWDGTYGKCGIVQDGVYVWQIEFDNKKTTKSHRKRGHVVLIR